MSTADNKDTLQLLTKISGQTLGISAMLQSPLDTKDLTEAIERGESDFTIMIMDEYLKAVWISEIKNIKRIQ